MTDRVALLRQGARLEGATVAYNTLEGGVAVTAGVAGPVNRPTAVAFITHGTTKHPLY